MLREPDHPAPPAPLDLDRQLFAACSELEVEESDRLFFCGQSRSRLGRPGQGHLRGCGVQGRGALSSRSANLTKRGSERKGTRAGVASCLRDVPFFVKGLMFDYVLLALLGNTLA